MFLLLAVQKSTASPAVQKYTDTARSTAEATVNNTILFYMGVLFLA